MLVICTKKYRFPLKDGGDVLVSPGPQPQSVPDEIRDTLLFEWAIRDYSIREIVIAEPVVDGDIHTDKPEKPAKAKSK